MNGGEMKREKKEWDWKYYYLLTHAAKLCYFSRVSFCIVNVVLVVVVVVVVVVKSY